MLADPLAYLTAQNTELGNVITAIGTDYGTEIMAINNLVPDGYKDTPWVRQMAADAVRLKGLGRLKSVDIRYPIEKAAYKAQKKKNQHDLAEKKELVEEGA
jgi:hypothetical protein